MTLRLLPSLTKDTKLNYTYMWSYNIFTKVVENLQRKQPEVFCKKVFLKMSQISQENTCAGVSFLIKRKCFSVNFAKILRTTFWRISVNGCFWIGTWMKKTGLIESFYKHRHQHFRCKFSHQKCFNPLVPDVL